MKWSKMEAVEFTTDPTPVQDSLFAVPEADPYGTAQLPEPDDE